MTERRVNAQMRVELTEASIRVRQGDMVLTITSASGLPDAEELADFVVYLDDIVHWDAPDEDVEVEIADLQRIVDLIEAEFAKRGLTVEFE